jgi:hypothetical protein
MTGMRSMNKRLLALCSVGIASVACATAAVSRIGAEGSAEAAPISVSNAAPPGKTDANAVPVLVELFTSEGCSSCPPADTVLAGLERTQSVSGARVVPIGLHVDYWDGIGWPDPFSSAQATQRQRAYSPLGSGNYTPQAVIDGRSETIGSRKGMIEAAIADAAKRPHATVGIKLAARTEATSPIEVMLDIGALPAGSAADAEVLVALTQNAVRVDVKRGENAGKVLEHTAVARQLVVAGPTAAGGGSLKASLKVPSGVATKELRVVAFVQERASRHILGSATRDVETP